MYGEPSTLIYVTEGRVELLTSSQGVHQGDPLGPALYSVTIHPILCQVVERHDSVTILAYLDDIYAVGLTQSLQDVLDDLKTSLSFGATQVRQISHAAYLSSWCQTINKLPGRFSSMSDLINYLKESESVPESIGSTLKSAFQLLPPLPKSVDNESEENQSIEDFISYP